jgi:hypothetical protein
MQRGATVSLAGHTAQSDAIHSPEACRSVVVSLVKPLCGSMLHGLSALHRLNHVPNRVAASYVGDEDHLW